MGLHCNLSALNTGTITSEPPLPPLLSTHSSLAGVLFVVVRTQCSGFIRYTRGCYYMRPEARRAE